MAWIAAGLGIIVFLTFQIASWNLSKRTQEAVTTDQEPQGVSLEVMNQSVWSPR